MVIRLLLDQLCHQVFFREMEQTLESLNLLGLKLSVAPKIIELQKKKITELNNFFPLVCIPSLLASRIKLLRHLRSAG